MSPHSIITIPLSGIVYTLGAIVCLEWALHRKADSITWSLSGMLFAVGILNAWSEEWLSLKGFRFEYVVVVVMILFVLAYRLFCLRLMEPAGLRAGTAKGAYSLLPCFYAIMVAMAILSPTFVKFENPPLALFIFMVLVCAVHVPMLVAGRSKVAKFVESSGIVLRHESANFSWSFFAAAFTIMGIPLVLSLIIGAAVRDDFRLFAINAVMTIIIFSLLTVFRRAQPVRN